MFCLPWDNPWLFLCPLTLILSLFRMPAHTGKFSEWNVLHKVPYTPWAGIEEIYAHFPGKGVETSISDSGIFNDKSIWLIFWGWMSNETSRCSTSVDGFGAQSNIPGSDTCLEWDLAKGQQSQSPATSLFHSTKFPWENNRYMYIVALEEFDTVWLLLGKGGRRGLLGFLVSFLCGFLHNTT